ncbi:hypothetical protein [Oribacterium sp. oral taxon 078]|nr:hypothetical protein [Oribacterium sp. oral taxon 078]
MVSNIKDSECAGTEKSSKITAERCFNADVYDTASMRRRAAAFAGS